MNLFIMFIDPYLSKLANSNRLGDIKEFFRLVTEMEAKTTSKQIRETRENLKGKNP